MPKILVRKVLEGTSYVEIQRADLRLLCACPEDAVKHLIKKGFVRSFTRDGKQLETGPNAILLSDIMLQNGRFSNLTEFVIAQMLYRQGMSIPGHENYGKKPILIGTGAALNIQKEYIFRGKYGLSNLQELISAGLSSHAAKEFMDMKLKFSAGEIQNVADLMDLRALDGDERIEIKNGCFIRRTGLNEFCLEFEDESVALDLSLRSDESYEPSFSKEFFNIKRDRFSVVNSGSGDGWDPHNPSMSSVLIISGKVYLIDAGPNIFNALEFLGIGINEIQGVFHTHCHDDHFAGLAAVMRTSKRTKYYATKLVRHSVMKKLSALLDVGDEFFYRFFEPVDLAADEWNAVADFEVRPSFSAHPVETNVFYFRVKDGRAHKTYFHLADISSVRFLDALAPAMKERIKSLYLQEADYKKIDVGGEDIHGNYMDFANDKSAHIVFSHIARDLTSDERRIGKSLDFGNQTALIAGDENLDAQNALRLLGYYFETGAQDLVQKGRLRTFAPGEIICGADFKDSVYLILTGTALGFEGEHAGKAVNACTGAVTVAAAKAYVVAGYLIDKIRLKLDRHLFFRALNYVRALEIPAGIFAPFFDAHSVVQTPQDMQNINFLHENRLFCKNMLFTSKRFLASKAVQRSYAAREKITTDTEHVYCITSGKAEVFCGKKPVFALGENEFFTNAPFLEGGVELHLRSSTPLEVLVLPFALIRDIPIVMWHLYATFKNTQVLLKRQNITVKNVTFECVCKERS